MKLSLVYVQTSKEAWADEAEAVYIKKLKAFCQFEVKLVKSPAHPRAQNEEKKEKESEKIIESLDSQAIIIALDEKGKSFKNSRDFSHNFIKQVELGRPIQFVIGGAFGLSEKVKERAHQTWTLSPLTFNHHLAKVVLLEQTYRAFSIWKGLPYHND